MGCAADSVSVSATGIQGIALGIEGIALGCAADSMSVSAAGIEGHPGHRVERQQTACVSRLQAWGTAGSSIREALVSQRVTKA